ncbi:sialate O-acetylesterase [Parapedobacter tibetensis]|uniref:sialate O-acetylesterase n=1 Tax=Parapedobacter tibetensis TaxID=2972951 RepID=UPI00214D4D7E|nr:sialate O-acetylesterase [Parapedobacter tibetensis]
MNNMKISVTRPVNYMKTIALLWVGMLFGSAYANIKLPAILSDGMVLQQRATVPLWGTSDGQSVNVTTSWNGKKYRANVNDDGTWRLLVKTPEAGGPYEIHLDDGSETVLRDVLIGEVWLASGQSNMGMRVGNGPRDTTLHAAKLIAEAGNPLIRLFRLPVKQAVHPLDDCDATWTQSDSASVSSFSAVAYQFALNLQQELDVPVGIVQSAYGGTKVQAWMDSTTLNSFPELAGQAVPEKVTKNTPTVLFNAMIYPVLGYGIKGAIWYQGEGNRATADRYADWFAGMVRGWRQRWGQGDFPFYYAQIAPYKYDGTHQSAYLREAQLDAAEEIPHAGMAVTMDVGSESTIHPPDKTTVANRLSNLALAETYKKRRGEVFGPALKRMKVDGKAVRLHFDHVAEGLTASTSTQALAHFEVAGADQVFYPAEARITGQDEVVVSCQEVAKPVSVRYAFKDWVVGDLYNSAGLPASSFRTDEW